ncbi:hypothetical protein ABW636_03970 [Aquimarina sp. 2201CG1-2-11]|uniref:hypothetical protein n=1 Tax=Aquimarina discodermiae TaxID=3231043 RepID=UPI0034618B4B
MKRKTMINVLLFVILMVGIQNSVYSQEFCEKCECEEERDGDKKSNKMIQLFDAIVESCDQPKVLNAKSGLKAEKSKTLQAYFIHQNIPFIQYKIPFIQ